MGMYTEIVANFALKENVPSEVITILQYLVGDQENRPTKLPDHDFFKCNRWAATLMMSSYYFMPISNSILHHDEPNSTWYLSSRSDLKNYDGEIEKFFDWIDPYVDALNGEFLGYSRYEESLEPILFLTKKSLNEPLKHFILSQAAPRSISSTPNIAASTNP